ncbi:MAG: adenosylcobinamide-GDP ribazoletransferase [Fibrobacteria bacterium]|nr:adenosylcobinamide-GDP ribazoletransferase [Fibrobacteria bacterium]
MNPFWLAWTFLTILPGPGRGAATQSEFVRSRTWYPFVGGVLGAVWMGIHVGALRLGIPSGIQAWVVLAAMLGATGFLHLDGLLDAADALLVPKTPEDRLRILKDVHMGSFAFGVGGLWLLGMFQGLLLLRDPWLLLALPVLSRGALLGPIHLFPYGRPLPDDPSSLEPGKGIGWMGWFLASVPFLAACWFQPLAAGVVVGVQLLFALWAARRLGGGITGDIYGAGLVLSELAALLVHGSPSP